MDARTLPPSCVRSTSAPERALGRASGSHLERTSTLARDLTGDSGYSSLVRAVSHSLRHDCRRWLPVAAGVGRRRVQLLGQEAGGTKLGRRRWSVRISGRPDRTHCAGHRIRCLRDRRGRPSLNHQRSGDRRQRWRRDPSVVPPPVSHLAGPIWWAPSSTRHPPELVSNPAPVSFRSAAG